MDAFLRWSHPDLLEPRLLHCCALWQVLATLGCDPAEHPAPVRGSVSEVVLPDLLHPLQLSSARSDPEIPTSFRIGEGRVSAYVFALLVAEGVAPDPLEPMHWRFWLAPAAQLHPDRRSIGLQALLRARGEALMAPQLAEAVAQLKPRIS